jgi:hypothetical protein
MEKEGSGVRRSAAPANTEAARFPALRIELIVYVSETPAGTKQTADANREEHKPQNFSSRSNMFLKMKLYI